MHIKLYGLLCCMLIAEQKIDAHPIDKVGTCFLASIAAGCAAGGLAMYHQNKNSHNEKLENRNGKEYAKNFFKRFLPKKHD